MNNTEQIVARLLEELSADEIAEYWAADQDGEYIQVNDNGTAAFVSGGRVRKTIQAIEGDIFAGINAWMEDEGFYPNIYSISDHGNVSMYDGTGNYLGGIV